MFAVLLSVFSLTSASIYERMALLHPVSGAFCDSLPASVRATCPLCSNSATEWTEFENVAAPGPFCDSLPPAVRKTCPLCSNAADWKTFEAVVTVSGPLCDNLPPAIRATCPLCSNGAEMDYGYFNIVTAPGFCALLPPAVRANCAACKTSLEASPLTVSWKETCANAHSTVTSLTPTSMQLGATTTMVGKGSVDEQVTGGTFTMSLKAGGGMVRQTFKGDICKPATFAIKALGMKMGSISWKGMNCPVAAGPNDVSMDVMLSSSVPRGMAASTINMDAKDQSGNTLICLEVSTK